MKMKFIILVFSAFLCAGCASIGDDVASIKGRLLIDDEREYKKCNLNVYVNSNGFHLLQEVVKGEFQVSFSVSPRGSEYSVRIDCQSDNEVSRLFYKELELGGGITSVDLGEIRSSTQGITRKR